MSVALEISGLSVRYGEEPILDQLSLRLPAGAYGVVVGQSGVGKSTLLRAIAGLTEAEGTIRIGERVVCGPRQVTPPEERGLGFLFQGLALWSHMTVEQHLVFALKGGKVEASEFAKRIGETLEALGIADLRTRRPGSLSGGERQRLALARSLVVRPGLLLLDEPTSSVDPARAREIRELLATTSKSFGTTTLHVTHDQDEAMELGDQVLVLMDRKIAQAGTPHDLYERPASKEVARFFGVGAVYPATVTSGRRADTALGSVALLDDAEPGPVWVLIRPDDLAVAREQEGVPVTVSRVTYRGGCYRAWIELGGDRLALELHDAPVVGASLHVEAVRPLRVVGRREGSA